MENRRFVVVLVSVSCLFLVSGAWLVVRHSIGSQAAGGMLLTWGLAGLVSLFLRPDGWPRSRRD